MFALLRIAILVIAVFQITAQSSAQESPARKAFIVGVNEYAELTNLTRPLEDAAGYADFFGADLDYEVTRLSNPTRAEFYEAFGRFLETINPGDEVIFNFSGHGWSDGSNNFLIFSDAPLEGSEYQLRSETVALSNEVLAELKQKNPKLILAIVDACRDYPFDSFLKSSGRGGLIPVPIFEGMVVLLAAGEKQKALDRLSTNDTEEYSLFTRMLLPALKETDRPIQDIARQVRNDVRDAALEVGHIQRPGIYDELDEDYCLSGACRPEVSKTEFDRLLSEIDAWETAIDDTSVEAFERYISLYPSGRFVQEAADFVALLKVIEERGGKEAAIPKRPANLSKWSEVGIVRKQQQLGERTLIDHPCSSFLIARRWAVTQATCVDDVPGVRVDMAGPSEGPRQESAGFKGMVKMEYKTVPLQVDIGALAIVLPSSSGNTEPTKESLFNVTRVYEHPAYGFDGSPVSTSNFALLELERDWPGALAMFPRGEELSPSVRENDSLIVAGFGGAPNGGWSSLGLESQQNELLSRVTLNDGSLIRFASDVLFETTLPVNGDSCFEDFAKSGGVRADILKEHFICARSSEVGAGTCIGDGGAGVWLQTESNARQLVGMVSYGEGCFRANEPELHLKLANFGNWVVSIIGAEALYGTDR